MITITKRIEVYFKNENDVESAHANLKTVGNISNLYIEEMPDDAEVKMFIPFFPTNVASSSSTSGSLGTYGAFAPFMTKENSDDDSDREQMTHLLRLDVEDEDYNQVIEILNNHECYVLNG